MPHDSIDDTLPRLLSGKVMQCKTAHSHALVIDGRFEVIGGRLFVVGTTPPASWPGYEKKKVAVAWEQVEMFYLFDSVEEWQTSERTWRTAKARAKRKSWFSLG